MNSLTSVFFGNRLPWNEIQGQSPRKNSKDDGAAFGRPTMLSMASLALALDFIPRQPITTEYSCQTTNGDPRDSRSWHDLKPSMVRAKGQWLLCGMLALRQMSM